jgi:hypothetical protein
MATEDFDSEFDAYKIPGIVEAPQMYAVEGDYNLSMDILPVKEEVVVPVNFTVGAEGKYTITANDVQNFAEGTDIYLEDLTEGKMIYLNETTVYEFNASPLDNADRFKLHFGFKSGFEEAEPDVATVKIYSAQKDVYVVVPESVSGDIEVYDIMGQLVVRKSAISGTLNKIRIHDGSGIYIVRMMDAGNIYSEKVFIK